MKQGKKILSFFMAVMMLLGCSKMAWADSAAQHVITITNEKAGHVYEAYQIFRGDLDKENKVLSNVSWGQGVDGEGLLAALKEQDAYQDCSSAKDVADVLREYGDDSASLDAFAKTAELYLSETVAGTSEETASPYTISVTGDGYYLIKDSGEIGEGDAYTKFMLQVVRDVKVEAKAEAPSLEKKIVEKTGLVDANSAAVGDQVEFQLRSKVPAMDGYEKYFFVAHDTLGEGLTFQPDTVVVKMGEKTLSGDAYEIVTEDTEDGCSFEIVWKNFIQYKNQAGAQITVTYKALVNQNAEMGNIGNANHAHLEYSNNPNVTQDGNPENPDKPGVGDPVGVTPDDVTITYLTGIELLKVSDGEDPLPLQGASFTITGEKLNQLKVIKGVYKENAAGTYYKLKDGTYTETAPLEETKDRYESTETVYLLETVTEWVNAKETVSATATVDANGALEFQGLAAGTYEIKEIVAPNGYNLLEKPIQVEIQCKIPEKIDNGFEEAEWKYSIRGAFTQEEQTTEDGWIHLTVVNKSGAVLPSTGGMGTGLFTLIGIGAAAAAIGMQLRKKRRNEVR